MEHEVIPILMGALCTITKELVQELGDMKIRGLQHCLDRPEY